MAQAGRREPVERVEQVEADWAVRAPPRTRVAGPTNVNVGPAAPAAAAQTSASVAPPGPALVAAKANQVLWFGCAVLEVLLALRFVLLLVGANPRAPFAGFVYGVTQPLLWPFLGLLPSPGAGGGAVLEVVALVAMLIYFLLFLLVTQLLRVLVSRPRVEV
jgi:uncharacterized protein YggT (Ycf19 family)